MINNLGEKMINHLVKKKHLVKNDIKYSLFHQNLMVLNHSDLVKKRVFAI